ncbi:hypothetical protein [Carbonactinospora thermoautotrophica]|uniref:hypothetical protein n=2 Tax=Carbonactinospora thermoautotrophica TaxID=1469144 RepID=UPI0018E39B9C|nr:hypothetical protein [Carbonactinospora thermoautotrophica]
MAMVHIMRRGLESRHAMPDAWLKSRTPVPGEVSPNSALTAARDSLLEPFWPSRRGHHYDDNCPARFAVGRFC